MADIVEADFEEPAIDAEGCQITLKLPSFSFGFNFPGIPFPPPIPIPFFGFELSCDPSKPIDVTGGVDFGGGRVAKFDPDPTEEDEEP